MRFSVLLVSLALFGLSVRAQTATATPSLEQAIAGKSSADAVRSAMMPSGNLMGAAQSTYAGMQTGLDQLHSSLQAAYANAGAQAEAAVAAFEAQYCTPASFVPSTKKPATFTGHSMSVTFSLGGCTFNETAWVQDGQKVLNCTQPSIVYAKNPANFTSKYHTAPAFTSKQCKVTKTFGEEVEKVLFVFDGSQAPDMNSLVAKITDEVKSVLATMGSGAQSMWSAAGSMFGGATTAGAAAGASAGPYFQYS